MNARKVFGLLLVSSILLGCDSNPSGPSAPTAPVGAAAAPVEAKAAVKGANGRLKQAASAVPAKPD